MRIAVLVKQIPAFEELALGSDGRLERAGVDLEMNAYCRRAVSQGIELAAAVGDGSSPPRASVPVSPVTRSTSRWVTTG